MYSASGFYDRQGSTLFLAGLTALVGYAMSMGLVILLVVSFFVPEVITFIRENPEAMEQAQALSAPPR